MSWWQALLLALALAAGLYALTAWNLLAWCRKRQNEKALRDMGLDGTATRGERGQ